jgi:hypothetical protein
MENFSTQWFLAFYLSLGALLLSYGIYLLVKTAATRDFLILSAGEPKPPFVWRKVLKYLFLFTLPGVVLSFFRFSWIELLFSIWSLFIIYMGGQLLVMWPHTCKAILENRDQIPRKIRYVAFNMITIGVILFMLAYILLERTRTL